MPSPSSVRRYLTDHPQSRDLLWSATVVLVWRLVLQLYLIFVLNRFPLSEVVHRPLYFLTVWGHYDGAHYVSIAQQGYKLLEYAFFPLYPLLIKIVAWPATLIFGSSPNIYGAAALIITTLSLVGASYFILQIARQKFDLPTGQRAILLLLFFPSAIFLGAIYTESLFICLTAAAFYYMHQQRWLLASLLAALAASTRSVGLILFFCLGIEFYLVYGRHSKNHLKQALPFLLVPLSLAFYMAYQWWQVGTPWQFFLAQKAWGRQVDGSTLSGLAHDLSQGLNFLNFGPHMIASMYDSLAVIMALALAAVMLYRRYWSFALLTLFAVLLPLSSGMIVGAIRYVLVAFPLFLLLGHQTKNQALYSFILASFAIFFSLLSIHYLNGWWLA